jgi:plasmid replication initiation protein
MPKKTNIIVKESNAIARARLVTNKKGVWDERIIALIVSKNRADDTVFQTHTVSVRELTNIKRLSTLQHREIKKSVQNLAQAVFAIPQGTRGKKFYPVFASIEIDDDGNIKAQINLILKAHYLELQKQFALRSLPEFQALTSIYSQQMFRFLNSWKSEPERTVPLDELHAMLGTPPSFRKDFSLFRANVLKPAHREINASTSLEYDWEPVREGLRKTVAVRFVFDVRAKRLAEARERVRELKGTAKHVRPPEDEELDRLQSESNACYEKFYVRLQKDCGPKKRSKRCQYCVERGRMSARLRQKQLDFGGEGQK